MATSTCEINYCNPGILDELIDHDEAEYLENGISELCLTRLTTDLTDEGMAKLCVDIVKRWLECFSHLKTHEADEGTITTIVGGLGASGIEKKYIETSYWLDILQHQSSPRQELNDLFENNGYRGANVDIASLIPGDPVERFVFHFIYDWRSKLKTLFQDQQVCEGKKIAVLKKQLENVVFYGRRRLQGSTWRMYSLPDDILRQALTGQGATVDVLDSAGSQLRTIEGRRITASADPTIPTSRGDGPKPDKVDRRLYKDVLEHAKAKKLKNLNNWTMVRASFEYKDDDREQRNVRCYAFSGVSPEKTSLPLEWWENSPMAFNDFYAKKGREILLAKGGNKAEERLGQNMVMLIFNALDTFYKEDLRQLTEFVAFEKSSLAEAMIEGNRNDLVTLDYGEYFDEVMEKVNKCNKSIQRAIEGLSNRETCASVQVMTTCGGLNQQYSPNMDGLREKIDDQELLAKVEKISSTKLSKLESELEHLPTQHLDKIRTVLGHAFCGEDNVLPLLLAEMVKRIKVFLDIRVTFVALDAQHLSGKPFCPRCGKKVRFFSILPSVLRFLGATGSENGKYLEDLFASLQT